MVTDATTDTSNALVKTVLSSTVQQQQPGVIAVAATYTVIAFADRLVCWAAAYQVWPGLVFCCTHVPGVYVSIMPTVLLPCARLELPLLVQTVLGMGLLA